MSETAYFADRSPTGHALGVLVTRHGPSEPWTYLPDEGGARRTLTGEPLYASQEEAVIAARLRWRCVQGRPRCKQPVPLVEVAS